MSKILMIATLLLASIATAPIPAQARATCGGWLGPCPPTHCDRHPDDPICD